MSGAGGDIHPHGDSELRHALAAIPLFAGISARHLGELARASRRIDLCKGQTIFRVGEPVRELFFLLSGQAKRATLSVGGNEKVLELLLPGQGFGEAELFGGQPYACFAVAVEPTLLLCVGGDSVRLALQAEPQLVLRVIASLARRAIAIESDATASHFRTGCQRVLDYLLAQVGSPLQPDGQTTLTLATSKQLIASRIGMTPETLSRVLRDLSDTGMIIVDGRNIHLQNAGIVRRMAGAIPEQPVFPRKHRQRSTTVPATRRPALAYASGSGTPSPCATINIAGRQRMLSQRLAKNWLLLGRGIHPARSRTILAQASSLFENQMATLASQPASDEVRCAQARVAEVWLPYRALLASEPAPKSARELFELNETVLAAAQDMTLAYARADTTTQGHLVNLAGRQRMLSQRMAKFYLFRHWGIHVARSRAGLAEATQEFATALTELTTAAAGRPRIEAQLERVSQHWQVLQSALNDPDPADARRCACLVSTSSDRLLYQMDAAVSLFEDQPG